MDDFLSDIAESQRCAWHGPRGLYHSLWEDGVKKKDSQPHTDKLKHLIGIELPQSDYDLLKDEDKQAVEEKYQSSKEKWQQYWKQKLGIEGNFSIELVHAETCPCHHF